MGLGHPAVATHVNLTLTMEKSGPCTHHSVVVTGEHTRAHLTFELF